MKQEWEGEVRPWAARKGVADLEKHFAEEAAKAKQEGGAKAASPGWETMSKLYALLDAPSDKDLEKLIKVGWPLVRSVCVLVVVDPSKPFAGH